MPGNRPERFDKAASAGADAVIIDLEDAVAIQDKETARSAALEWIAGRSSTAGAVFLRINGLRTPAGIADLAAVLEAAPSIPGLAGLLLPKARAGDVAVVADLIDHIAAPWELGALIETIDGTEEAFALARLSARLSFLMFGGADLAAELGVEIGWDPLLAARARLVAAAAGAGRASVDMPWIELADVAGEEAEMRKSFALGFTSRAAIHPAQPPRINAMLTPDPAALDHARRVMAAFAASKGSACLLDGRLIERPTIEQSRRLLARAGETA
ncbi:citrate lyase subunit beta [Agaricicola taiwanensis]|uniref:Citrate lyase subunit beta n=1 Tax=Agaricicola taiwanensis TaxID=591372 RepID=A0A8J2VUN8_9RHOB|nr:citrate lyase subunit beta [Agaricicola taiwanensis]